MNCRRTALDSLKIASHVRAQRRRNALRGHRLFWIFVERACERTIAWRIRKQRSWRNRRFTRRSCRLSLLRNTRHHHAVRTWRELRLLSRHSARIDIVSERSARHRRSERESIAVAAAVRVSAFAGLIVRAARRSAAR